MLAKPVKLSHTHITMSEVSAVVVYWGWERGRGWGCKEGVSDMTVAT